MPVSAPALWTTVEAVREHLASRDADARPLVLVPTMGDLHAGHLALVEAGSSLGDVVVSIFVNPTQFAPGEDFESYPRRLQEDVQKLAPHAVAGVFAPSVAEIYPAHESTRVEVRELSAPLCGRHRAGHFLGVSTVCTKLFVICRPQIAIFGQKDAQQCLLLHRMVRDLHFALDLVFVPTVRESDGLAMSSRNRYLVDEQREVARALSTALGAGRDALGSGERRVSVLEDAARAHLEERGVATDYAELRSVPDLAHVDHARGRMLFAVAGHVGRARLIDNMCLEIGPDAVTDAPLLDEHTLDAVGARWRGRRAHGKEIS